MQIVVHYVYECRFSTPLYVSKAVVSYIYESICQFFVWKKLSVMCMEAPTSSVYEKNCQLCLKALVMHVKTVAVMCLKATAMHVKAGVSYVSESRCPSCV